MPCVGEQHADAGRRWQILVNQLYMQLMNSGL